MTRRRALAQEAIDNLNAALRIDLRTYGPESIPVKAIKHVAMIVDLLSREEIPDGNAERDPAHERDRGQRTP